MSQHDFNIANQGFPATRADLNNALAALASSSSGTSEPSTTYAGQFWNDKTNNLLKFRNDANDGWITFAKLDQATNEWEVRSSVFQAVDSAGIAFKTDEGTTRATLGDDGNWVFTGGATFSGALASSNIPSVGALSNRNLIINGAMTIDQRNGGSSVSNANGYTLDRWYFMQGQVSNTVAHDVEQSSTAPADFLNSLKITVATAADPSTSNYTALFHRVEGYNSAQLNYGLSTTSKSTLSFWVNSSVTGTFGVALQNSAATRSYVGTYTIISSNTWERKTIVIDGDTSGTWLKDSGIGLALHWDIGVGTSQSTTAETWQSGNYLGLTGGTKLCETAGATFYITGVQLEVGDTATPFEHRSYGDELARCQRYYHAHPSQSMNYHGFRYNSTRSLAEVHFPTTMRAIPTVSQSGNGTALDVTSSINGFTVVYNDTDDNTIDEFTADAEL